MIVNYYSVKGCKYEVYQNQPVLFPPPDTDENLLRENGFIKMLDGRWYRVLNVNEYKYVMEKSTDGDVTFDENYKVTEYNYADPNNKKLISNILSVISLIFSILGFYSSKFNVDPVIIWGISVVLVVVARIICPKNIIPKILGIIYFIAAIIITILLIYTIVSCINMCDSCFNDCEGMG